MNISKFFIDRPIFASVISVIILLVGSLAYFSLPVSQYPEVAPPTVQVVASYPGASAETLAKTVATPLEQGINGVEGMLYMLSQSTGDGVTNITVTFELGTDIDQAQVLVQNRVASVEPRLPETVRRLGVTTRKNSPDLMMVVNLYSPDQTYDQTYIANYLVLNIRDRIARINGVGDTGLFGASEYAMRVWIDPEKAASLDLTGSDIVAALRAQNLQVAGGILNQSPTTQQNAFELSVQTKGRLQSTEEFLDVIVKSGGDGRLVKVGDVARVELGAQSYTTRGFLGRDKAIAVPIYQRPGSNALETANAVKELMQEVSADFPPGLTYEIAYNPTEFVQKSINAVLWTLLQALGLVVLVIYVFLQSFRAALIPVVAIPVSLIGTFAFMAGIDFSLNNLSLLALVLAIGIVVDDAIVVVENVARELDRGKSSKEAAQVTMKEVSGALVATSLVLVAVFLPTAFLGGISGQFYKQFGVVIAVSVMLSTVVTLTLSPALAAILMRRTKGSSGDPSEDQPAEASGQPARFLSNPLGYFFARFNAVIEKLENFYERLIVKVLSVKVLFGVIYLGLIILAGFLVTAVPTGFIPQQDQGYFIVGMKLLPGSSLERTEKVVRQAQDIILEVPGIANMVSFAGFDGATFTNATNAAGMFPVLDDFAKREEEGISYDQILSQLREELSAITDAFVVVIPPPPVRGIGSGGGIKMMVQDKTGNSTPAELYAATMGLVGAASKDPNLQQTFSFFETSTPQIYLDIDRAKAQRLNVSLTSIFSGLEVFIGSVFVNEFNYLGRTFRVTAQADAPYRLTPEDALKIKVRSDEGSLVPLGSLAVPQSISAPYRVPRYNLYPSAAITGDTADGRSSGQALAAMEKIAADNLPEGFGYEWTDLSYQQKQAGNTAALAFGLAVVFVFLLLAAQYESWVLPLSIILIVPMCLLAAFFGLYIFGQENNILTQIGLVVLIGLATKNAILIVEFAKQFEDQGMEVREAAIEAAKTRLRPILMTSFSFILGTIPLIIASGAGAEMRQAIGITVFCGMIGVTFFGLIYTPLFYVVCRTAARRLGVK